MAEEITSKSPAAVDKAAAKAPAATKAITQFGNCAISGLASTIISLSIYISFSLEVLSLLTNLSPFAPLSEVNFGLTFSRALPGLYCIIPS